MHHRWKKGQSRTCNVIVEFLVKEHVASFTEIKEYVNGRLKYGVTSQRLGNILQKYPEFVKVGMVERQGYYQTADGNSYKVTEWALSA